MKRAEALKIYEVHSGKASDVARQLALAGIAVVWIFRENATVVLENGKLVIPHELVLPLALLVAALACDLLQYFVAALLWGALHRIKELRGRDEFTAPRVLNWPAIFFFWAKAVLVLVAYYQLFRFIVPKLK